MAIGNSQKAMVYGAQQLDLMQRNGWHTTFDSYNKDRSMQHGSRGPGGSHGGIVRVGAGMQGAKGGGKGVAGAPAPRDAMQACRGGAAVGSPGMQHYSRPGMMMPGQGGASRPGQPPPASAGMRPGMNPVCLPETAPLLPFVLIVPPALSPIHTVCEAHMRAIMRN